MKELSLNILDIAENSVKAGALLTEIYIDESKDDILSFTIKDNGCGMNEKTLSEVTNPFYTTRTTRKVGMGIPLLKLACEQTGGSLSIRSTVDDGTDNMHGTTVNAIFCKNHIDFTPMGDIVSTVTTLVQGHPQIDFLFKHDTGKGTVLLDTREIRSVLEDIPLDTYEVILWIKENLEDQYLKAKN